MKDKYTNSRFNQAPSIVSGKKRTRFDIGGTRRFTCNTGDFVPFYCQEVLPGDTFDVRTSTLTRLETSIHQTMDNAYLEIAYFYVPNRIIMTDWDKLLGANDDAWARQVEVSTPQLFLHGASNPGILPASVKPQSLLNYLYLPAGNFPSKNTYDGLSERDKDALKVTLLPLRATFQIYNDWFRDENLDSIVYFSKGNSDEDLDTSYLYNGNQFLPASFNLSVNRFRDRFSSALPAPQKGAAVTFSVGGLAPLTTGSMYSPANLSSNPFQVGSSSLTGIDPQNNTRFRDIVGGGRGTADPNYNVSIRAYTEVAEGASDYYPIDKTNIYADLSQATAITVNDLRLAIAAQVLSEQEARGGTRLTEVLFSQWNINAPSLMLDRSEYLGGRRIPIQMLEVLQTSETSQTSVLGEDAGHSKTFEADNGGFLKSFMFHGYVIGIAFLRTARSYSQGIDRQFRRTDKYSYFNPIFDNIGEVPVYSSELYAFAKRTGNLDNYNGVGDVFGYQEAWYEYKEGMNRDSGYMQTGINGSLQSWHYGDLYASTGLRPLLSYDWLKEDPTRVDRTIAVSSNAAFQWSCFIDVEAYATRQMAKYSVPNTFGFGSK